MFNNIKVNTDEKIIAEILKRDVAAIYPNFKKLEDELKSGKRLKIYAGADATGSQLHLGHTKIFLLLEKLRQLGHEVFILFGDFTAMVGDPTDKSSTRVKLSKEQVEENLKDWKKQISKVVKINDLKNPAKIVFNSTWLSKMSFGDVLELSSNFTVQQMIERDMFSKRIEEGKPIYIHEFLYPLMQGYDSVHLDVDLYKSTLDCLKFFYPRVNKGGIIISHDYPSVNGVKKAFDEFFKDKPEPIIRVSYNQCLIVKIE